MHPPRALRRTGLDARACACRQPVPRRTLPARSLCTLCAYKDACAHAGPLLRQHPLQQPAQQQQARTARPQVESFLKERFLAGAGSRAGGASRASGGCGCGRMLAASFFFLQCSAAALEMMVSGRGARRCRAPALTGACGGGHQQTEGSAAPCPGPRPWPAQLQPTSSSCTLLHAHALPGAAWPPSPHSSTAA